MIVDSSAVLAVVFGEPDFRKFAAAIASAPNCSISAGSLLELSIVAEPRQGRVAVLECDSFLHSAGIIVEPVTEEQSLIARDGFFEFGKGRHPAGLNFGDCFSYALAKVTGEPLLFKGDDFRKTDITPALP